MKIGAPRELGFLSDCQWTAIQHAPNRVLKHEQRQFAKACRAARSHPGRGRGLSAVENAQQAVGKNGFRTDRSTNDLSFGREDGLRLVRDFAAKVIFLSSSSGVTTLMRLTRCPESKPAPRLRHQALRVEKALVETTTLSSCCVGRNSLAARHGAGRTAFEGKGLQRDRSPRFRG